MKYLITVNKQDDIKKVKSELVNLIGEDKHPDMLVVAEVFNRHISKILVSLLKILNLGCRYLYDSNYLLTTFF